VSACLSNGLQEMGLSPLGLWSFVIVFFFMFARGFSQLLSLLEFFIIFFLSFFPLIGKSEWWMSKKGEITSPSHRPFPPL